MRALILSLIVLAMFSSCEKVIQIDLEETEKKIVIEGRVYLGASTFVRVTRTSNFYDNNDYKRVTDAEVYLYDELGTEYQASLNGEFDFIAPVSFKPEVGQTYSLKVIVDGETFTSSSEMKAKIPISTLELEERDRPFAQSSDSGGVEKEWIMIAGYDDPANESNFYLFDTYTYSYSHPPIKWNRFYTSDIQLESDELSDGKYATKRFFQDEYRQEGDTGIAVIHHIDEGAFRYFSGLADVGGPPGLDIAPGNPESNISGGALGYFGCFSTSRDTIRIE